MRQFPVLAGFAVYLVWILYALRWFWGMHPMNHAGVDSMSLSFVLVLFAWLSVSLAISFSILPLLWFMRRFTIHLHMIPPVYASLWVLTELVGSLLFFLLTYAEQSLLGPHYTFVYVGYFLADTPLNPLLAPLGGIYLLSWFVVFVILSILIMIRHKTVLWPSIILLTMIIILGISHRLALDRDTPTTHSLKVAALRVDSSPTFRVDSTEHTQSIGTIDSLIGTLVREESVDIVALGEDSRYLQTYQQNNRSVPHQTTIIDSGRLKHDGMVQSVVQIHESNGLIGRHYEKQLLVSEGEYLSWYYRLIALMLGQGNLVQEFERSREYSRGDYHENSMVSGTPWAVTMCSELYSPLIQSRLASQSQIMVNLASHSVLRGHPALERQTKRLAQVRAAENNRYLIRSNNNAPAFIVDHYGTVVAHADNDPYTVATVRYKHNRTLFSQSPWLIIFISLLVITCAIIYRKKL